MVVDVDVSLAARSKRLVAIVTPASSRTERR